MELFADGRGGLIRFRTDARPLPEGDNYTREVEQKSREPLAELKKTGERQALDRKLRQAEDRRLSGEIRHTNARLANTIETLRKQVNALKFQAATGGSEG